MRKTCKKKTNITKFRVEKVIKGKGDNLCVKWKSYNNSFNSWMDKKDRVYKLVNIFLNYISFLVEIFKLN